MRIASNQYATTVASALQDANAGLSRVMQQMASGQRYLLPSDDSVAAVRLARLSREQSALQQYGNNIGALQTRLSSSEATLSGMKDDLLSLRDLMVWANTASNTPDDLKAMASSVAALRDSLFDAANTRNPEGQYVFSGTASNQAAVLLNAGAPLGSRYSVGSANAQTQDVAVADGVTVPANVSVPGVDSFLNGLDGIVAALQAGQNPSTLAPGLDTLQSTDQMLGTVSSQIGVLGGRQSMLQTLSASQANVSLANKQAQVDVGQLDYAEAATQLNSYTQAVQATQKAYAKVSSLSLFDAL